VSLLVDPDRHRNVGHVVKLGDDMLLINQTRIGRRCSPGTQIGASAHYVAQRLRQICGGANPAFNASASAGVKSDWDYREIPILQLFVDALPDWPIEAASSPRGPRHQQDLLPTIVREQMQPAIKVGQREVGRFKRMQVISDFVGRVTE
jgi:hypothetical protein